MHGDLPLDDQAVETLLRGETSPGAPPELVDLVRVLKASVARTPDPEETIDLALLLVTGREPTPGPARSSRPRRAVAVGVVAATLAIASPLAALSGAPQAIGRSLGLLPPLIGEPAAPGPRVAPPPKALAATHSGAEPTTVPPFVGVPEAATSEHPSSPTNGTPGRAATAPGHSSPPPGQDKEPANQANDAPAEAGAPPDAAVPPPADPPPQDPPGADHGGPPDNPGNPPHEGPPPGQDGTPGSSEAAPGHTETPPGHGGTPPGHGGTPPGLVEPTPSGTETENDNGWSEQ